MILSIIIMVLGGIAVVWLVVHVTKEIARHERDRKELSKSARKATNGSNSTTLYRKLR